MSTTRDYRLINVKTADSVDFVSSFRSGKLSKLIRLFAIIFVVQCSFIVVYIVIFMSHKLGVHIQLTRLPPCPSACYHLVGQIHVNVTAPTLDRLEGAIGSQLHRGGAWKPHNCTAIHRVALVVPFRDRDEHLRIFLQHMHPFLQKQLLDYQLFIVEQSPSSSFNRGMLLNVGFIEASKRRQFDCFIFHDVDLLPENDRNLYSCPSSPRHMSVAVDSMAYRLIYDTLFGGAEAFPTEQFRLINGFSNRFFGWGAEDDNLYNRIVNAGLNLTRYSPKVARYRMLRHNPSNPNPLRLDLLEESKQQGTDAVDGLNNVQNGYNVYVNDTSKLYTRIYVDINQKSVIAAVDAALRQRKI